MKILLLLVLLILSGCAPLSEDDCKKGDWEGLGYKDAMKGYTTGRTESYQKACSEYGISVDQAQYDKGFKNGLKKFCTFNKGLEVGLAGKPNHLACEKLNPDFKQAYQKGYAEYMINKKKKEAVEALRKRLMAGSRECNVDDDCSSKGHCDYGLCRNNSKQVCSYDSDCAQVIKCIPKSGRTDFNDKVEVRICADN